MFPNLSETLSVSRIGREILLIRVEIGIRKGLPNFQILGLASQNTKESRDRLRLAIESAGFIFPFATIIVNLYPNHKPKKVSFFDLAITLGILEASGQWQNPFPQRILALGSVSLSGRIHASEELLELLWASPKTKETIFLIPSELRERHLPEANYIYLSSLEEIKEIDWLPEIITFPPLEETEPESTWDKEILNPSQMLAFSGLCYSLLGRHHALMVGNPGTGKTKLAQLVSQMQPSWQPSDLNLDEGIPLSARYCLNGKVKPRPFRQPHHTTTEQALVGGGSSLTLGEVSLAHGGILFLDELTLFREKAIESLREPMEAGKIEHARVLTRETLPADCTVIAALNPCPCGNYLGIKTCHCSKKQIRDYLRKISGPFLDRISIHIHLFNQNESRTVEVVREDYRRKLNEAMDFRMARLVEERKREVFSSPAERMNGGFEKSLLRFSYRQKQNTMQLARTIADFNLSSTVKEQHLLEAYEFVQNSLFFEDLN